jgi:uncharacterized protein YbbC (DUF1343 family)
MTRCYPGTVLFEGTTLSEGRATTAPLEMVGAPDIEFGRVLRRAEALAPEWLAGCTFLRQWVDNLAAQPGDLENRLAADERAWTELRRPFLIY